MRHRERTLFASTAGQIFDKWIYNRDGTAPSVRYYVEQPVIRLQDWYHIGQKPGVSSSFVHIATEQLHVDVEIHLKALDDWLTALSGVGIFAGHLILKMDSDTNVWLDRTVVSEMLRINYGGLEIGVANYFPNVRPEDDSPRSLSDIGFGLERLCWVRNKTLSYFDSIGPVDFLRLPHRVLDHARTAVLMVGSGVRMDHKNHGSKLKRMIQVLASRYSEVNISALCTHYHNQWSQFVQINGEQNAIAEQINREASSEWSRNIAEGLGLITTSRTGAKKLVSKQLQQALTFSAIHRMIGISMKTARIFLGGGGDEKESLALDLEFAALLDSRKPLVYIPNAMEPEEHEDCLQWFTSVMRGLKVSNFQMWSDLLPRLPLDSISGIYVGGGDVVRLSKEIRRSGFDRYLSEAAASGLPCYGGSAGAILLGADVRTAPEAEMLKPPDSRGLDLLQGCCVVCHHDHSKHQEIVDLSNALDKRVIAIPESSGVFLCEGRFKMIGLDAVEIFQPGVGVAKLQPGESLLLR